MKFLNISLFLSVLVGILPSLARAQAAGCDEGVIRLPDRSGTVVICSAIASKIPHLAKQLTEATKLLGSQQAQLAELTRLVRGLNGVSNGIGVARQTQMLQNLSGELASAQRGGDEKTKRTVEDLSEKIDELQSRMLAALTNQSSSAATTTAIKGPVGDSIAKLEFSSAARQLGEINTRLQAIQGQISEVKNDTTVIKQDVKAVQSSLKNVAKEVSDDPRKELVKRGYSVDYRGLENAIQQKDFVAIELFNTIGYIPTTDNFPRFLFYEFWDAQVFKALSAKLLGAPKNCKRWKDYIYTTERDREKLLGQIRVCGRNPILEILQARLEAASSQHLRIGSYEPGYGDIPDIEALRKTVNPLKKDYQSKAKKLALEKAAKEEAEGKFTSGLYLDPCTFNDRSAECQEEYAAARVPGISPESFAKIEQADLKMRATWNFEKKSWIKDIENTIRWVKNVPPSVDVATR